MKRALINIDYTVDFIADEGALTSGKPGQQIEESINKYVYRRERFRRFRH